MFTYAARNAAGTPLALVEGKDVVDALRTAFTGYDFARPVSPDEAEMTTEGEGFAAFQRGVLLGTLSPTREDTCPECLEGTLEHTGRRHPAATQVQCTVCPYRS